MLNIYKPQIYGDNVGLGFPTILNAWEKQGWEMPELIEDTVFKSGYLKFKNEAKKVAKKSDEKK